MTDDDEGFSLIELIVSMSVMAVIMVIVTGAITEVYSDVNRTDNLANARDQIGNSFRRLDKELRYANWVATPGQVNSAWYLEYGMPGNNCQQLVFKNGVLTRATWVSTATSTPGAATTIATDLAQTGTTAPFTVYQPGDQPYSAGPGVSGVGIAYQPEHSQVRLRFTGKVGKTTLPLDVLFSAQNTNRNTSALSDCSSGRPTS
ncbi:prepilin-type N-terminal cleavage/methylation domain-containing protein [Actinoplanes tereljensis]|uniref:Prepilin-type N-terminal cleavage/methylation domain-containing protein n=1 Tax=Paractinoplanes tereljensis TaxID=571912 RepID=A0A919TVX9_9ACTN|nr:prepilin-type N-terminal cleavage/methylation domain-containing protein [Actinoplanes tereljensis]GIF25338.1 hypothetical protein Ate02nite_80680 [Actinoplanes tereljensis]